MTKHTEIAMDANALRAMQAPIKERYKADPQAAVITLKAKGTLDMLLEALVACAGITIKARPPVDVKLARV
jgi:ribosome assembly protein YihI (activator of Der GTPase)